MTDERLRAAERAAAGGDDEAAVRALQERLRAGALTRDRLEAAAWCGHAAARAVLGLASAGPPRRAEPQRRPGAAGAAWLCGPTLARACLAVWSASRFKTDTRPALVLEAALACRAAPTGERRFALGTTALGAALAGNEAGGAAGDRPHSAAHAIHRFALLVAGIPDAADAFDPAEWLLIHAGRALDDAAWARALAEAARDVLA